VDICIAESAEEARERVRTMVALPVWVSYPNLRYVEALGIRLPDELRDLVARREYGDIPTAGRLLPDEMFQHFAIAGTEEQVTERIGEILPLIDELIVHPVGSADRDVDDVAERVAAIWASRTASERGRSE
jgi:alkanesulfonate monooxygenase SsuD/methylene tetrahydromethanopterin reductase-like flavin-dependent oxidoreductase (luciferase family)